jgi:hypothetical protein
MTITGFNLIENDGQVTRDGPRYRRVYQVFFTDGYDPAYLNANTETELQRPGEVHPLDNRAYVTSATPSLDKESPATGTTARPGVAYWEIQYEPLPFVVFPQNPLSRPVLLEGAGSDLKEVGRVDSEGNPIVNSAGDYYDPLPERPIQAGQYTLTRNESDNPVEMARLFSNTTNSATWHGRLAGKCMMGLITYRKVYEVVDGNPFEYWQVSYPIKENTSGWRFKPIDNGWRKVDEDGNRHAVTDPVGNTTMTPVLLDGSGGELPPGGTPVVYPSAGYKVLIETAWSALDLPNPDTL